MRFTARVAGRTVKIPYDQVTKAVQPRYPKDTKGTVIDLTNFEETDVGFLESAVSQITKTIGKLADRHVGPETGEACVLLPEDRWRSWPLGASLLGFLDGPVRNYFLGQAIVERGGHWPFGQWSHGVAGQMEYYRDVFGTDRAEYIEKYLEYIIAKKLKGHWECPCGRGAKTRSCHMKTIILLREQMPRSDAQVALKRLRGLPRQ